MRSEHQNASRIVEIVFGALLLMWLLLGLFFLLHLQGNDLPLEDRREEDRRR